MYLDILLPPQALKNVRDIIKDYDILDLIPLYQMCDNSVGMNRNIMKEEHENKKNSQSLNRLKPLKSGHNIYAISQHPESKMVQSQHHIDILSVTK